MEPSLNPNVTSQDGKMRVAVVGAGVAGLLALRHFGHDPRYQVVGFERQNRVGGVWNYPAGCETHTDAPWSSEFYCRMYRDLISNGPTALNYLLELPLLDEVSRESFLTRDTVCDHIHSYAKTFGLLSLIKFRHRVALIEPFGQAVDAGSRGQSWRMVVEHLEHQTTIEEIYDVVIICNGQNDIPYIPTVPGLDVYGGKVMHASQYRVPEVFAGQNVLIIGGGASAVDVTSQLAPSAKQIIVCRHHQLNLCSSKFVNVVETTVKSVTFTQNGIFLANQAIDIDTVILCTGYQIDLPFLSPKCGLEMTRGRVWPLYRQFINCHFPSMIVIGLLKLTPYIAAGPEMQIQYYKAVLEGRVQLPSKETMVEETEIDYKQRLAEGLKEHQAHLMAGRHFPYLRQLAGEAGLPTPEPVIEKMWFKFLEIYANDPYDFRNCRLDRVDSDNFIYKKLIEAAAMLKSDTDI